MKLLSKQVAGEIHKNRALFSQLPHPCACQKPAPSSVALDQIIEGLWDIIFPLRFHQKDLMAPSSEGFIAGLMEQYQPLLQEQIHRGLCFFCGTGACPDCENRAKDLSLQFFKKLPQIQVLLASDVTAHYEGDPASICPEETILCYPGLLAIACYRLAHELHLLKIPLIPRMMTELAHSKTGIDIHPGATIGKSFFIDHGTGTVIGETCIIGERVRLYQGVTLGAKSFPKDKDGNPIKGVARHPIVEDDVIIYSGATILGRITLGKGAVIGGNVWLMDSVAPGSRVLQK